ncbi:MAG: hypothetical protein WC564_00270 [Patescibacteria group bacterium]
MKKIILKIGDLLIDSNEPRSIRERMATGIAGIIIFIALVFAIANHNNGTQSDFLGDPATQELVQENIAAHNY